MRVVKLLTLARLHSRHEHRHGLGVSDEAHTEHDFFSEQRTDRLDAIGNLSQLLSGLRLPPIFERRIRGRLLLGECQSPADREAGIRDRAVDA